MEETKLFNILGYIEREVKGVASEDRDSMIATLWVLMKNKSMAEVAEVIQSAQETEEHIRTGYTRLFNAIIIVLAVTMMSLIFLQIDSFSIAPEDASRAVYKTLYVRQIWLLVVVRIAILVGLGYTILQYRKYMGVQNKMGVIWGIASLYDTVIAVFTYTQENTIQNGVGTFGLVAPLVCLFLVGLYTERMRVFLLLNGLRVELLGEELLLGDAIQYARREMWLEIFRIIPNVQEERRDLCISELCAYMAKTDRDFLVYVLQFLEMEELDTSVVEEG